MPSPLSFDATKVFRDSLLLRNLKPYTKPGSFTPTSAPGTGEIVQNDYNVFDSPDILIDASPFVDDAIVKNVYKPDVLDKDPNYGKAIILQPKGGEYGPVPPYVDAILRFSQTFQQKIYTENLYGPSSGLDDSADNISSDDRIRNQGPTSQNYWDPISFVPSSYSPYEIILQDNPQGSDGTLSQDSYMQQISAEYLKENLQYKIDQSIQKQTIGRINFLNTDPSNIAQMLSGKRPLVFRDYKITVGGGLIGTGVDLLQRIAGITFPFSPIPGDYFEQPENQENNAATAVVNTLTGGLGRLFGLKLNKSQTPSQLFLEYTGEGQKAELDSNISLNKYRPSYVLANSANFINTIGNAITNPLGLFSNSGSFYVGSPESNPTYATSPPGTLPINELGVEVNSPVYPDALGIQYEGDESKNFQFGLNGKSFENGGGIQGGFSWLSPKWEGDAGKNVGPGGVVYGVDPSYDTSVSNGLASTKSTNYTFQPGSILDETQRLIDAVPESGPQRFSHVGNAIDQTSKIFNDGYKEMTKGSQVISYVGPAGQEVGQEYCRIFTKDTPFYQYSDLQRRGWNNETGNIRKSSYSVINGAFDLNIVPYKDTDQNIIHDTGGQPNGYVKKYLFSIENLAWRTSSRPGYTYQDLPVCERGPNGGRIMWFPPYDLQFDESTKPEFKTNNFLGRPEPVYTYQNTSRTGNLRWKIIVDHPSVLNLIVNKVLANQNNREIVDSVVNSFFAGCRQYDLYDLAIKYNTIPTNELFDIQQKLNNPNIPDEDIKKNQNAASNEPQKFEQPAAETSEVKKFINLGFYFENDCPGGNPGWGSDNGGFCPTGSKGVKNFESLYTNYTSSSTKQIYQQKCVQTNDKKTSVANFFTDIIEDNFNAAQTLLNKIRVMLDNDDAQTVTISMIGSASAPNTKSYNVKLSKRRIESVRLYVEGWQGGALSKYLTGSPVRLIIKEDGRGETTQRTPTQFANTDNPKIYQPAGSTGFGCEGVDFGAPQSESWYDTRPMACRVVTITNVEVEPKKLDPPIIEATPNKRLVDDGGKPQAEKPKPSYTTQVSVRENISKKIIRNLLSECDYFQVIKENDPIVFDSIKDKIKYFQPVFHSTTPEGLNSRLTFLQQCMRPGDTIPTVGPDGNMIYNDAINTSFGSPPILVLRIGDFYNTKIVPTNISFKFENFDINPEGIGFQPMIAEVNMTFNFIGGSGMAKPIEELQNAISFNFYANTELYDDRATATEDTSALDKQVVQGIIDAQPTLSVNALLFQQQNGNGSTIGKILTAEDLPDGSQQGTISYTDIMDTLKVQSQEYFTEIQNFNTGIIDAYNYGIFQAVLPEFNYLNGSWGQIDGTSTAVNIWGKPTVAETNVNNIFTQLIKDIETGDLGLFSNNNEGLNGTNSNINKKQVRTVQNNYKKIVQGLQSNFISTFSTSIQTIVEAEQKLINTIDKLNFIITETDGVDTGSDAYVNGKGEPVIYNISGKTVVNGVTVTQKLIQDFTKVATDVNTFTNNLKTFKPLYVKGLWQTTYTKVGEYNPIPFSTYPKNGANLPYNREFMVMAQTILDEKRYDEFLDNMVKNIEPKDQTTRVRQKVKAVFDSRRDEYRKQQKGIQEVLKEFSDSNQQYLNQYSPYPNGTERVFDFKRNLSPTDVQKTNATNLYSTVNIGSDNKVYNLKKKLD